MTELIINSSLMAIRFGAKIRARRAELGLSQDQVAEKAGLHRNTVGRIEKRAATLGDIERKELLALAYALELTPDEMSALAEGSGQTVVADAEVTTPAQFSSVVKAIAELRASIEARIADKRVVEGADVEQLLKLVSTLEMIAGDVADEVQEKYMESRDRLKAQQTAASLPRTASTPKPQ